MKHSFFTLHSSFFASLMLMASMTMMSCQESLEDRLAREDREYTMKYCPTPPDNNVITDSLVFDKKTKTQYYYLTFTGEIDDAQKLSMFEKEISNGLLEQTRSNTQITAYKEAGFAFAYVCRSKSTGKTLLNLKFTKKDYDKK